MGSPFVFKTKFGFTKSPIIFLSGTGLQLVAGTVPIADCGTSGVHQNRENCKIGENHAFYIIKMSCNWSPDRVPEPIAIMPGAAKQLVICIANFSPFLPEASCLQLLLLSITIIPAINYCYS